MCVEKKCMGRRAGRHEADLLPHSHSTQREHYHTWETAEPSTQLLQKRWRDVRDSMWGRALMSSRDLRIWCVRFLDTKPTETYFRLLRFNPSSKFPPWNKAPISYERRKKPQPSKPELHFPGCFQSSFSNFSLALTYLDILLAELDFIAHSTGRKSKSPSHLCFAAFQLPICNPHHPAPQLSCSPESGWNFTGEGEQGTSL